MRRPRRRIPVIGRLEECFLCGGERAFVAFGRPLPCPLCRGRGRVPVLMFFRELLARFLILKGSAIGCVGSACWLFEQTEAAGVLIPAAACYLAAGWYVETRMT